MKLPKEQDHDWPTPPQQQTPAVAPSLTQMILPNQR